MRSPDLPLRRRRILVVEDDYLVAEYIVELLHNAGAEVIGPFSRLEPALTFLETGAGNLDGAVLDVNLNGEKSYPIANRLIALAILFCFSTGYGSSALDPAYQHLPRCEKPFSEQALITALTVVRK